jgi:hypothetical protein
VKNRTRIGYRIEANQRFDDRDPYFLFRSFRAAMNQLVEMNDPLATLIRMSYRGSALPHELQGPDAGRTLACWTINDKGEVVRFSQRWISLDRKRERAKARSKRIRLTHNGEPYTRQPESPESQDIPF